MKPITVWARLGATINVGESEFKEDPVKALKTAIRRGKFDFDGDSYVPETDVTPEIRFNLSIGEREET